MQKKKNVAIPNMKSALPYQTRSVFCHTIQKLYSSIPYQEAYSPIPNKKRTLPCQTRNVICYTMQKLYSSIPKKLILPYQTKSSYTAIPNMTLLYQKKYTLLYQTNNSAIRTKRCTQPCYSIFLLSEHSFIYFVFLLFV